MSLELYYIKDLKADDIREMYLLDGGAAIEPYPDYLNRIGRSIWAHYRVEQEREGALLFVGYLSLEKWSDGVCSVHLCMIPRQVLLRDLIDLMARVETFLFRDAEMRVIRTEIRPDNRATILLALACGLKRWGDLGNGLVQFGTTRDDWIRRNSDEQTETGATAVSEHDQEHI